MFEIIMLFAFLYAATCQLLPERTVTTRPPQSKKDQTGKREKSATHFPINKDQATRRIPPKIKSRSHSYADAA